MNDQILTHHHHALLVVLSILVAVAAGYAALDLAQRAMRASGGGDRRRGLLLAALTMGVGIWTMHFLGMLSFHLRIDVSYEPALLAVSIVPAVIGAGVALEVVTRPKAGWPSVLLGGAFMGLAVAAMHYIGMTGLRAASRIDWDPWLVVLSIAIAYGASLFALGLVHNLHAGQRWRRGPLLAAAASFGVGVAGLHYVAMFAATFYADPGTASAGSGAGTELLAILLAAGAALMLLVLLFGAGIDRQRGAFSRDLAVVARMMRNVVRGDDARTSICRAALELSDAVTAALIEPGEDGRLETTTTEGDPRNEPEPALAVATYESGERRFEPGRDGQVATLYEPVKLDGRPVGVLFFVWPHSLRTLSERSVTIAGLLAAEASFAIDRADMVRRLERQARTDELTGLPNRRTVTAELGRRLEEDGAVAVAMLDLDRFKEFNDRYGHQGGDRLLEAVAVAWSAQLDGTEMVGRYGGEEFLAVLPGCALTDAVAVADALRAVLPLGVTCSAGVAVWNGEESAEALVARADAALYAAKSNGRDRTEAAPEARGGSERAEKRSSAEKPAPDPIGRFLTAEGMRAFLDGIPAPFVILDLGGVVLDWNQTAAATFGIRGEDAIGRELAELLDCEAAAAALATAAADGSRHGGPTRARPRRRDGSRIDAEIEWFLADVGEGDRIAVFVRDVGRRNERDRRLRRFEDIVAFSDDAVISGSAEGLIETWNPAAERLYGYSADEAIGKDIGMLRPAGEPERADRKRRREVLAGRSVSIEVRERRRDGAVIDVAATISPLRDEEGEVSGFVLIARDVSESTGAAEKLAQANAQFAGAFEAAAIGMTLTATDGRFLAVNAAFCRLLKRDPGDVIGRSFQELTHPDDLEPDLAQFRRVLAGEIDSYQLPKRYLLPDGGILWGLLTVSVVRDGDGTPLHFVSQVQDIADRMTAQSELRRYAEHLDALAAEDPLTGLRSANGLVAALSEELSVQSAGGPACSLVTIGIDGGDAATLAAAEALREVARGEDLAARLGDAELAVLLPGVGEADADAVVARLRGALSAMAATLGVATARPGDDPAELLARARDTRIAAGEGECATVPSRIEALLELVRRQLGTPVSFLTRLDGDSHVIERAAGERERFGIVEGAEMPLDGSHCARMLDGGIGSAVADLAELAETRDLEVTRRVGIRAYAGVPVRLRSGEVFGTLCVIDTAPHPELSDKEVDLLRFVSMLAAEAIDDAAAEDEERVAETSAIGVRALLVALEARDKYTGEHSREVVRLASRVAERLGLDRRMVRDVEQVALLHDVGKVGIPDAILQKQGPLDEVEWEVMRKHPIVGERIIAGIPGLSHLAPAMRAEHERWDGAGYPDGLAGERIPIASRITLACDAFHAMTSERPYRPAMAAAQACAELRRNAGSQFDPAVVVALLAELEGSGVGAGGREDVALRP